MGATVLYLAALETTALKIDDVDLKGPLFGRWIANRWRGQLPNCKQYGCRRNPGERERS